MSIQQRVYKLTRPDLTTYRGYQYVLGQEHMFPGTGPLCSSGWSHAYLSQPLAELLNPIHAGYSPYVVYEADGVVGATDRGLKIGCSAITLVRMVPSLHPTMDQRVAFSIACALHVCRYPDFVRWACEWLEGKDRSKQAAHATAWADWAAMAASAAAAEGAEEADAAREAARAAAWAATETSLPLPITFLAAWAISLGPDTSFISLPKQYLKALP